MQRMQRGITLIDVLMVTTVVLLLSLFFRGAFVDQKEAVRALENHGFSNIQVTDKSWFIVGIRGCDSHDAVRFTVRAVNPIGKTIETYVCTGWPFKGSTIRSK